MKLYSIDWDNERHIIRRMQEQQEEDGRLALVGYIVFLALGFTLGVALF